MNKWNKYCPNCGCPLFEEEKMCPGCLTRVDMERPNKEDYKHFDDTQSIYPYCRDLETYCDEVEKALDKACKTIDDLTGSCPADVFNYIPEKGCLECTNSIDCWKEYLVNAN